MKILYFNFQYLLNPQSATILDDIKDSLAKGDEVTLVTCDADFKSCYSNPLGDKEVCEKCINYKLQDLSLFEVNKNIKIFSIKDFLFNLKRDYYANTSYNNVSDIKGLKYENYDIGMSCLSTYISLTRNKNPLVDEKFRSFFDNMLSSALTAYYGSLNAIETVEPDLVKVFNGRFSDTRSVIRAAEKLNIRYEVLEVVFTHERFKKISFKNSLPHSIIENERLIEEVWNNSTLPLNDRIKEGESFYNKRALGEIAGDKVYTLEQSKGKLPDNFDFNKNNIVIFNSSEDEFAAIGDEWDVGPYGNNQLIGINRICESLSNDSNYAVYLRVHPNLVNINYAYHQELYSLDQKFNNITVIPASSDVCTYTLMKHADKVITFGSSTGIEAAFWKKPVILLGGCFYRNLGLTYNPSTHIEVIDLIKKKLEIKLNINIYKYGYYIISDKGENFKFLNPQSFNLTIRNISFKIYNYRSKYHQTKYAIKYFIKIFSTIALKKLGISVVEKKVPLTEAKS